MAWTRLPQTVGHSHCSASPPKFGMEESLSDRPFLKLWAAVPQRIRRQSISVSGSSAAKQTAALFKGERRGGNKEREKKRRKGSANGDRKSIYVGLLGGGGRCQPVWRCGDPGGGHQDLGVKGLHPSILCRLPLSGVAVGWGGGVGWGGCCFKSLFSSSSALPASVSFPSPPLGSCSLIYFCVTAWK